MRRHVKNKRDIYFRRLAGINSDFGPTEQSQHFDISIASTSSVQLSLDLEDTDQESDNINSNINTKRLSFREKITDRKGRHLKNYFPF